MKEENSNLSEAESQLLDFTDESATPDYLSVGDNPLLAIIDNLPDQDLEQRRRKAERVAAYSALSNIFTTAAKGIAATEGVAVTPFDNSYVERAQAEVDRLDDLKHQDHLKAYQDRLNSALQWSKQDHEVGMKLLDGQLDKEADQMQIDAKMELDRKQRGHDLFMETLSNVSSYGTTTVAGTAKDQPKKASAPVVAKTQKDINPLAGQKVAKVVYNEEGVKVPLMAEDVTKLYLYAQMSKLDTPYNVAPNETARRHEWDLMIQQAYIQRERELEKARESKN